MKDPTPTKAAKGAPKTPASRVQKNGVTPRLRAGLKKAAAKRARKIEAGKSEEEKKKDKEAQEEAERREEERRKEDEEKKRQVEEARKKKREEVQERMKEDRKTIEEKKKAEEREMRERKEQKTTEEEKKDCEGCKAKEEQGGRRSKCKECLRQYREAANANSPLLRLPAELRNAVYEFAFTGDVYFVTARDGTVHKSASVKHPKPYNRLQEVCRQLQAETTDIDIRTNKTYVIEGQTFIEMCNAKDVRLDNLHNTVVLHGEMTLDTKPYEPILHDKILALAWRNPQAEIIVRVERLHFNTTDGRTLAGFFSLAGTILTAMRGIQRFQPRLTHVHDWQRRKSVGQLNAPNLRFFPRDTYCDVEELTRLAQGDSVNTSVQLAEYYNNDVLALVADVASWYEVGL